MQDEDYQRGLAKRQELFGADVEQRMEYFKRLAPDLDRITVQDLFGRLLSQGELAPRMRSLCIIAILATQGRDTALKNHINGALSVGATEQEIIEVLHYVFFFAGLPAASGALRAADEVFKHRGAD